MPQLYIVTAIFLWSSMGIIFRIADVPVHIFLFYSLLVAITIQSAIVWKRGYLKGIQHKRQLLVPVILGLIGLVNNLTFFYAYKVTTISNAVLTHYTAPIIVAFLSAVLLKERLTVSLLLSILLATAGLLIMLGGFNIEAAHMSGILSGLLSGFAYAVLVVIARKYSQNYHSFLLTYIVNITIAVCLAPFVSEFPVRALWSFIVIGIVHSIIAPVLYYQGLKSVSAGRTAVLGYLEPVSAIILSALILKEVPGLNSIAGGALILASGYLTIRSGS